MIRFLIHTVSSLTDVYGNRYHYATITSTKTGKDLRIKSLGGPSNARHLVRTKTDADWSEINSTEADMKIREFNRSVKFHETDSAKYEHEITDADFVALECSIFYECGICDHIHPITFDGDCRDDANRLTLDQLPADADIRSWEEVQS